MQRFTISLDDELATQFDALIADPGSVNRSEAVRDMIRSRLDCVTLNPPARRRAGWRLANVSYVYDRHDHTAAGRVLGLQHDHHEQVITRLHPLLTSATTIARRR